MQCRNEGGGGAFCFYNTANVRHSTSTSPNRGFEKVPAKHGLSRSFATARE
jgi:hypothetical protein